MSPSSTTTRFTPAPLPVGNSTASSAGERARAAGYAAGYAAGAHAAADAARAQAAKDAQAHAHRLAELDRADEARKEQVRQALDVLADVAQAASARALPVIDEAVHTLHRHAITLAEAILGRELTPGPGTAQDLLDRALTVPADLGVHTIRVSEADHARIVRAVAEASAHVPEGISLVADSALADGDVISEYPHGFMDAQVTAALARAWAVVGGEA